MSYTRFQSPRERSELRASLRARLGSAAASYRDTTGDAALDHDDDSHARTPTRSDDRAVSPSGRRALRGGALRCPAAAPRHMRGACRSPSADGHTPNRSEPSENRHHKDRSCVFHRAVTGEASSRRHRIRRFSGPARRLPVGKMRSTPAQGLVSGQGFV